MFKRKKNSSQSNIFDSPDLTRYLNTNKNKNDYLKINSA